MIDWQTIELQAASKEKSFVKPFVTNCLFLLTVVFILSSTVHAEEPYPIEWSAQLGVEWGAVYSSGIAIDDNKNVYVSGHTTGLLGDTNNGNYNEDAFLAKYDSSGTLLWAKQPGTPGYDYSTCVAVDHSSNVLIGGYTAGTLGDSSAGNDDAFLAKYDPNGNLLWTEQFGTSTFDSAYSIAVDSLNNTYITGKTLGDLGGINSGRDDTFLAKYDVTGNLLWTRQLGSSDDDIAGSVAVDEWGNAFIAGYTEGDLADNNKGGCDIFLAKYDTSGSLLWSQQFGSSESDLPHSLTIDDHGNIYLSGNTKGDLFAGNAGGMDAFLMKLDNSGNILWNEQIGTSNEYERAVDVVVDGFNGVLISGYYSGSPSLLKFNVDGDLTWINQLDEEVIDIALSLAVDQSGDPVLGGWIFVSSNGTTPDVWDASIIKFNNPCPLAASGDFNCDGEVSLADLDILGHYWGADDADPSMGDASGDGRVSLLDLDILSRFWGQTFFVPEPGSLSVITLAILGVVRRR